MAEKMNNLTGKEWLQESFTIWSNIKKTKEELQTKHPALFPQKLPEKLINLYTKNSGEIILDPFMGIGSTMMATMNTGTKGVGIELNKKYCSIAKKRVKNFQKDLFNSKKIYDPEIICDNSNNLLKHVKEDSVDLVVTSPPYWNILNQKRTADNKDIRTYSTSKNDIGNVENYEEFLQSLKNIFQETYKALKMNRLCISVVMDIRKKDKFFPLHEDQTRIMKEIGFELEEYVIWNRQSDYNNMKTLGYPYVFRFNKVHEFICIYWKR